MTRGSRQPETKSKPERAPLEIVRVGNGPVELDGVADRSTVRFDDLRMTLKNKYGRGLGVSWHTQAEFGRAVGLSPADAKKLLGNGANPLLGKKITAIMRLCLAVDVNFVEYLHTKESRDHQLKRDIVELMMHRRRDQGEALPQELSDELFAELNHMKSTSPLPQAADLSNNFSTWLTQVVANHEPLPGSGVDLLQCGIAFGDYVAASWHTQTLVEAVSLDARRHVVQKTELKKQAVRLLGGLGTIRLVLDCIQGRYPANKKKRESLWQDFPSLKCIEAAHRNGRSPHRLDVETEDIAAVAEFPSEDVMNDVLERNETPFDEYFDDFVHPDAREGWFLLSSPVLYSLVTNLFNEGGPADTY